MSRHASPEAQEPHYDIAAEHIRPASEFYLDQAGIAGRLAGTSRWEGAQGGELSAALSARIEDAPDRLVAPLGQEPVSVADEKLARDALKAVFSRASGFLDNDPSYYSTDANVLLDAVPIDSAVPAAVLSEIEAVFQAQPISDNGTAFRSALDGVQLNYHYTQHENRTFVAVSLQRVPKTGQATPAHAPEEREERLSTDSPGEITDPSLLPAKGRHAERRPAVDQSTGAYFADLAGQIKRVARDSNELAVLESRVQARANDSSEYFVGDQDPATEREVRLGIEQVTRLAATFIASPTGAELPSSRLLVVNSDEYDPADNISRATKKITEELELLLGAGPARPGTAELNGQTIGVLTKPSKIFEGIDLRYHRIPGKDGKNGSFEVWLERRKDR